MNLIYKNYRAESDEDRFNLYVTKDVIAKKDTANKVKGKIYESEQLVGYGYTFESLLKKIAAIEVAENFDVMPLAHYSSEFKKTLRTVENILK